MTAKENVWGVGPALGGAGCVSHGLKELGRSI